MPTRTKKSTEADTSSLKYTKFKGREEVKIPNDMVTFAENSIDRAATIKSLDKFMKSKTKSQKIEQSIFEFTLIKVAEESLVFMLIPAIYQDKANSIILNLDKKSSLGNMEFLGRAKDKDFDLEDIAFMNAEELYPDNWERYSKRKEYQQKQKDEVSVTDIFTCYRCGEKKCRVTQLQTRSADEPMTNFVTCMVCMNTFFK